MACYHPVPAFQPGPGLKLILHPPAGYDNVALPCGQCIGCRSEKATQWAHRCAHEAGLSSASTFLTLTYDDENLPRDGHLRPRDLTLFIKRLRKSAGSAVPGITTDRSLGLRYLACGEYGSRTQRPHYHAIVFNLGFSDRYAVGKDLYRSSTLDGLWPSGLAKFGDATPAAASYIAQYNLKKQEWDPTKRAPFLRMSRRPAIGIRWLQQFQTDLRHGYLVENARRYSIPRSYKRYLAKHYPELLEELTLRSKQHQNQNQDSNDPARLQASETIHLRYKQLTESRNL